MVIKVTGYCDYSFRKRSGQRGTSARDLVSHREVELWDSTNGYFRREPVSVPNGEEASKRAEVASLRRSEERYRSFIEQSAEGIWRFELEEPVRTHLLEDEQIEHFYRYGYLAECNDAMAKMYGFSRPEEIVGARLGDLLSRAVPKNLQYLKDFVHSGYQLRVNRAWEKLWGVTFDEFNGVGYNLLEDQQLIERGVMPYIKQGFAGEPTLIPPIMYDPDETSPGVTDYEDSRRWVRALIYPVKDETGNIREITLIHEDITERAEEKIRKLNEELEQRVRHRTAQLEEANRELESFSYLVSHDLRAPLRHIGRYAQVLQQRAVSALGDTSRRYLNTIAKSADRAKELIDGLLSLSRLGRTSVRPTVVNMNHLVWETLKDLQFETNGRDTVWEIGELAEVRGDPSMLRLVMQNLLSNALKYTRTRQRAVIEVGSRAGEEEAVFFVRDNGVGFDEAYKDKLFGVFQRLHNAEDFEGTGVGLATVRRSVERHEGRTWAEGGVGSGATFYFSLPALEGRNDD